MKVVAIVQARMASTRLPGKVLRWIGGQPMVVRIAERLGYCASLNQIVLATPENPENDVLAKCWSKRTKYNVVRGSETAVDARLLKAAVATGADAIVRVTGDCPLVDPGIVDGLVQRWRDNPKLEYVSNVYPLRTWPDGLDVEVISRSALEFITHKTEGEPWDHEALSTNIWKHPHLFLGGVESHDLPGGQNLGDLRWTVDRPDDLYFVRWVYEQLPDGFRWREVLGLGDAWSEHVATEGWRQGWAPGQFKMRFGK